MYVRVPREKVWQDPRDKPLWGFKMAVISWLGPRSILSLSLCLSLLRSKGGFGRLGGNSLFGRPCYHVSVSHADLLLVRRSASIAFFSTRPSKSTSNASDDLSNCSLQKSRTVLFIASHSLLPSGLLSDNRSWRPDAFSHSLQTSFVSGRIFSGVDYFLIIFKNFFLDANKNKLKY